ncbi:MAG TPA: DUF3570 domain-containing protein [Gammaproteobacteria bacterium]|nr:DUF3570 domain-containing protein [Gammaproteobacteria bacterium]
MKHKSTTVAALTGAAMSLPAFSGTQPAESTLSVSFSQYREADIPKDEVVAGSNERYDIEVGKFRLVTPVGADWSLTVDATRETMSGASPWGTLYGATGEPNLIMSGATIRDSRTEVALSSTRYTDKASYTLGVARSEEDDYKATSYRIAGEWDRDDKLSTIALGFSYSSDELSPTEAVLFGRVPDASRRSRSISGSWTQVLGKNAVLQSGISLTKKDGYLDDPYKLRDVRPDERTQWALSLRYRRFYDNRNAALHLDYRYYDDDWGIDSHTIDLSWHQNLGIGFQLVPRVRIYSQAEASFFEAADDYTLPKNQPQSSDYRLSGYGALSVGLKAIYRIPAWTVSLSVDQYRSDERFGHNKSRYEHPALLDFTLTNLGLEYRF